ncbi:Deoxyhypusine synthase [Platanthera guangdongensis]|uniref:Deoxyhypusine synthase n=1 Tax=Platanthera guangdongensis TaxID=2320717 RepID=A0ABR2MH93_9ASPA
MDDSPSSPPDLPSSSTSYQQLLQDIIAQPSFTPSIFIPLSSISTIPTPQPSFPPYTSSPPTSPAAPPYFSTSAQVPTEHVDIPALADRLYELIAPRLSLLLETSLAPLIQSVAALSTRLSSLFPQAIPSFGCLDPAVSESRQGEMPHEDVRLHAAAISSVPAAAISSVQVAVSSTQAPASTPQSRSPSSPLPHSAQRISHIAHRRLHHFGSSPTRFSPPPDCRSLLYRRLVTLVDLSKAEGGSRKVSKLSNSGFLLLPNPDHSSRIQIQPFREHLRDLEPMYSKDAGRRHEAAFVRWFEIQSNTCVALRYLEGTIKDYMTGNIKISAKAKGSLVEIQNPIDWQREAHMEQKIHMFNSKRTTAARISSIAKSFSPPLLLPPTKDSHAKTSNPGKNTHEASTCEIKKRTRGPTTGIGWSKRKYDSTEKVEVHLPADLHRFVGDRSQELITRSGRIVRLYAPLNVERWAHIPVDIIDKIIDIIYRQVAHEDQQFPIYIRLWEKTKKGKQNQWIDEAVEEIYNKLLELHEEQKKEKGEDKLTTKEAYTIVLGKRSGYIPGMGPGPKPLECESSNGRLKAQIRAEVEADMSAPMLSSYGPNFLDPRGKLLARSFDILGLYSIFIFQKSNPDVAPPFLSPMLQDEDVNVRAMDEEAVNASPRKTGVIILGGGVLKHHICNANMLRNGADYAVFINTAQEFDCSDLGARLDEAVSWGKISAKTAKVHSDATIVFPLEHCIEIYGFYLRLLVNKRMDLEALVGVVFIADSEVDKSMVYMELEQDIKGEIFLWTAQKNKKKRYTYTEQYTEELYSFTV